MFSSFKIFTLLIACFAVVCVAKKKSQVNEDKRHFILIVEGLDNLKTLIRGMSTIEHLNVTYKDNVSDRNVVEASIQQGIDYSVPSNSYALVLTTDDQSSTEAIHDFLEESMDLRNVNVLVGSKNRRKRISGLVVVGTSVVNAGRGLVSAIRTATRNNPNEKDPYGKVIVDSFSKGLLVFSVGMTAASLVPNPVTPSVAVAAGVLSLGLDIAKDVIWS